MKVITDAGNLKGVRVIVRASLNVPVRDGVVQNAFRLKGALPTLRYLHERGAKIIIIGHIGRDKNETLKPVLEELQKHLPVHWGGDVTTPDFTKKAEQLIEGECLLAENLRQDEREAGNDYSFAKLLAAHGDMYVNDAFDNIHREHASMVTLPTLLPAFAGLNLAKEVAELRKVMVPTSPSLFLLGGAKFETKIPLVEKYLALYDHVFIGGALMNDVFKARGFEVGTSLVSDVSLVGAAFLNSPKLLLPVDVVVTGPMGTQIKMPHQVAPDEKMLDCGPATVAMLAPHIRDAKTVLWNGPF